MKIPSFFVQKSSFGGSLLKGKRKSRRPLSVKHGIHTVLKANVGSCGSFCAYRRLIQLVINKFAVRFDIKVYEISINSNHVHLLIKLAQREDFARFVRALCGAISLELGVRWYHRPFTRLVGWGRQFFRVRNYVCQNFLESCGLIPYVKRRKLGMPN